MLTSAWTFQWHLSLLGTCPTHSTNLFPIGSSANHMRRHMNVCWDLRLLADQPIFGTIHMIDQCNLDIHNDMLLISVDLEVD